MRPEAVLVTEVASGGVVTGRIDGVAAIAGLILLASVVLPPAGPRLWRMLRRAWPGSWTRRTVFASRQDTAEPDTAEPDTGGPDAAPPGGQSARPGCTVFDAALLGAVALAVPVALMRPQSVLLASGLGAVLLALALFDLRYRWLPDVLTLPMAAVGLLVALRVNADPDIIEAAIGLLGAAGLVWGVKVAFRALRGVDGLGGGDIKLIAAMGAWLGPADVPVAIAVASIAALCVEVAGQLLVAGSIDAARRIPFGAYLAAALWVVWLWRAKFAGL